MARSLCSLCPEDGTGPGGERLSPRVDEELFRAVCTGFLAGAGAVLSPLEVELLVLATQSIATELGSRFLADYLCGDTYFSIERPAQNLDRATVQLRLAEELRRGRDHWEGVVRQAFETSPRGRSRAQSHA
eukprot:SAG11_NODE_5006_length_1693_cov_1.245922_3_plen_131_part_00